METIISGADLSTGSRNPTSYNNLPDDDLPESKFTTTQADEAEIEKKKQWKNE